MPTYLTIFVAKNRLGCRCCFHRPYSVPLFHNEPTPPAAGIRVPLRSPAAGTGTVKRGKTEHKYHRTMKKTASALFAAILLAAAGLMLSCKSQGGTGDFNNAGGKPYEIVVSIDQEPLERRSGRHAPFDTARTRSDVQSGGTAVRHFACQSGRPQRPHPAPPQHPHHTGSIRKRPNLRPSHNTTYMPGRRLSSP